MQLSKEIGCTPKIVWFILHRLRHACESDMDKFRGIVEVDEFYLCVKDDSKHRNKQRGWGRGHVGKQPVMGIYPRDRNVRVMPINKTDQGTIQTLIQKNIAIGFTFYPTEVGTYTHLDGLFYKHQSINHSAKQFVDGVAHTNGIESVWALLKCGFHCAYRHLSTKHTAKYAHEFSFRLNEGNSKKDALDCIASVIDGAFGRRLTCAELI